MENQFRCPPMLGARRTSSPVCCSPFSEQSSTSACPALARHLHAQHRTERGGTRAGKRIKKGENERRSLYFPPKFATGQLAVNFIINSGYRENLRRDT